MAWQTTPLDVLLLLTITGLFTLAAAARVTRLVTEDTLTQPLRDYLERKAADRWYAADESNPDHLTHTTTAPLPWRWAAKLTQCAWCSGFWISAAFVLGYFTLILDAWPWTTETHAFTYVTAVLASSQVVGLAADWFDSPPPIRHVQLMPAHVTVRQQDDTTP